MYVGMSCLIKEKGKNRLPEMERESGSGKVINYNNQKNVTTKSFLSLIRVCVVAFEWVRLKIKIITVSYNNRKYILYPNACVVSTFYLIMFTFFMSRLTYTISWNLFKKKSVINFSFFFVVDLCWKRMSLRQSRKSWTINGSCNIIMMLIELRATSNNKTNDNFGIEFLFHCRRTERSQKCWTWLTFSWMKLILDWNACLV